MRALLITLGVVVVLGALAFVGLSVQWQDHTPQEQLGPSEAQQNRAQEQAVQKSAPLQQLSPTQIRRYQERLDAEGFATGSEKGTITPQTEAALRAYQRKYGLPTTGELDEPTQRSLVAGQMPTPGRPTEGESVPGGSGPGGSPR
ncbi:MAG TPA: peptidoglycan-binding domain-containing protein [Candidatus Tectomicrobia bacterium]|nr:peptidoglycan-binding domain-containing protein [Candidatus Tectomicrobia bacterium]